MIPCPPLSFAFAGFRHPHVFSLVERIRQTPGATMVATWEEDAAARDLAREKGVACPFVDTLEELLALPVQVLVVGEAYGRRESVILAALRRGIHVLSDKPFCTTLAALEEMEALCQAPNSPRLGCMFDLGTTPGMTTAERLVREGTLGDLLAIQFNGMHPLNYRQGRPDWYFQPGMHGGTINDLASHAFDYLPRLCQSPIRKLLFAQAANRHFPECPHFQNVAQLALEMESGAVVTGDVSYATPRGSAFTLPSYWRFTVTGTRGWMEFTYQGTELYLAVGDEASPRTIPLDPPAEDYFDGFLKEIQGQESAFPTRRHFQTARWCLEAQALAER